ncbi:MAG: hypothetical protein KDB90_04015 [Planctomycetes bacterium]|nr:hypothetical protein [Planctomycetota bacterium]
MESFVARMQKLDAHRLALAPLLGLLAGFLVNRAHDGSAGWALLAEMGAGAIMVSFGAAVMSNVSRLMEDRDQEAALLATAEQQAVLERKRAMVEAEAERYRIERFFREQIISVAQRAERLEHDLTAQRAEADVLRRMVANAAPRQAHHDIGALASRLEKLETANRLADEAREKIAALETAQEQMLRQQVALDRRASAEAEELKASLLQLAITESQRLRNMAAPENDQSGRIIELESRIHRLAREIEAISSRQPAQQAIGTASSANAAPEKARIGFLQAMLDANKTLRKQIKEAA